MKLQEDTKYAIGRKPSPVKVKVIEWDDLPEPLNNLEPNPYRSEQEKNLREMDGFKHLAWTPRVRHLYYNPEADLLVKDVEGDLFFWKNPSEKTIEKAVQQYPMAEVSLGEKYDSRFD